MCQGVGSSISFVPGVKITCPALSVPFPCGTTSWVGMLPKYMVSFCTRERGVAFSRPLDRIGKIYSKNRLN